MRTFILRTDIPATLAAPISNEVGPSLVGVPIRVPLPPAPPPKSIPGGRSPEGTKTVGVGLPAAVTVNVRSSPLVTAMLNELVKWGLTCAPSAVLARPTAPAVFGPTPTVVPTPTTGSMIAAKGRATNRAQDDRSSTTPRLTKIGDCRDRANLAMRRACGSSAYMSRVPEEGLAQTACGQPRCRRARSCRCSPSILLRLNELTCPYEHGVHHRLSGSTNVHPATAFRRDFDLTDEPGTSVATPADYSLVVFHLDVAYEVERRSELANRLIRNEHGSLVQLLDHSRGQVKEQGQVVHGYEGTATCGERGYLCRSFWRDTRE